MYIIMPPWIKIFEGMAWKQLPATHFTYGACFLEYAAKIEM